MMEGDVNEGCLPRVSYFSNEGQVEFVKEFRVF